MGGPTELIRQNCPLATESYDGLMSKEQVVALDSQGLDLDASGGAEAARAHGDERRAARRRQRSRRAAGADRRQRGLQRDDHLLAIAAGGQYGAAPLRSAMSAIACSGAMLPLVLYSASATITPGPWRATWRSR